MGQYAHLKLCFLEWMAFGVIIVTPCMACNESTKYSAWDGQVEKSASDTQPVAQLATIFIPKYLKEQKQKVSAPLK